MKNPFALFLLLVVIAPLATKPVQAQHQPDSLCHMDFRPIGAHPEIPQDAIYANKKYSAEIRAADVVRQLTFEEKLALTGGSMNFYFPGVSRLGIPPVYFADATQGIHEKNICTKVEKTTAFPSGQALAATWNRDLAFQYAAAISEECRAWGISVLLGPGLNLYRNSEGGRNFEYFGEDPYLASQMGVSYVRGMQSLGTVATVKHFLGNEQEFVRHVADVQIGERALREIYLPPFKAAIEQGGALAVMTGNNLLNGHPGAADMPLSQGVLRNEYGFRGTIMSDWANSMYWRDRQADELNSGHSLLMGDNHLFAEWVKNELISHPERKAAIEDALGKMAEENLYSFFKMGIYDRRYRDPSLISVIESHQAIARQVAEESITLLKNADNILPLEPAKTDSIVVVGSDEALSVYAGKGSGAVKGYNHIDFLTGLHAVYGNKVKRISENDDSSIRSAKAVLYFISKPAGENMDVPYDIPVITEVVQHLVGLNKNLIVIFSGGNGFSMPWLPQVKGLIFAYLLGQQRGVALANVLSGKINPSGKLPFSIEKSFQDSPAYEYNRLPDGAYGWGGSREDSFEAQRRFRSVPIKYKEGIYIGYRWYEKKKITPLFPFGYGLSYTTFTYSDVKTTSTVLDKRSSVQISFAIRNTGTREGKEIAQVYLQPIGSTIDRPIKELKGFQKISLKPGESQTVTIPLHAEDLAYWDESTKGWKIAHGSYEVLIGPSSGDIRGRVLLRY